MHGLPPDLDLSFLEGITLLQVCVGANEIILNFDDNVSITIESTFRIRDESGRNVVFEEPRSGAVQLIELLSNLVKEASGYSNGTLRLSFSRGEVLEIYDSSTQYESYQIRHGDTEYVV